LRLRLSISIETSINVFNCYFNCNFDLDVRFPDFDLVFQDRFGFLVSISGIGYNSEIDLDLDLVFKIDLVFSLQFLESAPILKLILFLKSDLEVNFW
jgi:hypothetical protein